ncbi:acyltransferase [Streptomyces longispororuber]|uniref:Acyltransferase n=1 Tax=Streptomyces longispororuber TaxID=68230 RepID=A0A919DU33_9ACTN|nr:acyltransferase [Streptomyces longispororuber]GHE79055.1 acyltransferase [Streptomyces longispororuber]
MRTLPAASARLPALTGLRFVAALCVFVCHAALVTTPDGGSAPMVLFLLGPAGVSLFFVLSGFVLAYSARSTDTAKAFWRRRIVKIYPSHLVVWAGCVLLFRAAGMPRISNGLPYVTPGLPGDLTNALLLNTLVPVPEYHTGGNDVTWSLTCELLFYLLFPLLYPRVARVRPQRLPAVAAGAVAVAWTIPLIALGLGGRPLPYGFLDGPVTDVQLGLAYTFPPSRLPEFVLGMVLARMHRHGYAARVGLLPSVALAAACLLTGIAVLPRPFLFAAAPLAPVALIVWAVATSEARGTLPWLRTPAAVFLGEASYAFYLVHRPALAAVGHYGDRGAAVTVCGGLLLALAASWLLYALVEKPCCARFAGGKSRARARPDTDSGGMPVP